MFPEVLQVQLNPVKTWWLSSGVTACSRRPPRLLPVGSAPAEPLSGASLDGWLGCNTMANVTSCQPLNRGVVSGGCRQPAPCQSGPLVWEWRLSGDWLSLIKQRRRGMEESVACQPQTSSSWTSNSVPHPAWACLRKFMRPESSKLSLCVDIEVKVEVQIKVWLVTLTLLYRESQDGRVILNYTHELKKVCSVRLSVEPYLPVGITITFIINTN